MNVILYVSKKIDSIEYFHQFIAQITHSMGDNVKVDIHHRSVDLSKQHTTILHIFSTWSDTCAKLIKQAYKLQIPIVYSPLGSFQPWTLHQRNIRNQLWQSSFQKSTLQRVSVLHAFSAIEFKTLKATGWNSKIVLIKNPIITNDISAADASQQIYDLYTDTIQEHDRLIRQQIDQRMKEISGAETNILRICTLLLYAEYQFRRGEILQETLAQIAGLMTSLPYNESRMVEVLQELGIKEFTARIENIAEEYSLLTEGFMPINKLNDKTTKQIRSRISKGE